MPDVYSSHSLPPSADPPPEPELRNSGHLTDTRAEATSRLPLKPVLLGLGAGVFLTLVGTRLLGGGAAPPAEAPSPVAAVGAAQAVTTVPVQLSAVQDTLTVNGTVQAVDLLEITPQIGGLQIQQVLVREGDTVTAGQTLAVLDDATLQADIREAQAQLSVAQAQVIQRRAAQAQAQASVAEARQNLERSQALANRGAISQQELTRQQTEAVTTQEAVGVARAEVDSAEAEVRSQQAAIDRLQTQLNQTVVRSPVDGIIAERLANIGSVASNSAPLFSLIQNNQLELEAEVPQAQLNTVDLGAPVTITSSSDDRIQLQGTVRDIQPVVDSATRTAIVNITLPASNLLRPGMFLRGAIVTSSRQGLVVPSPATLPQADGQIIVYVLGPDNRAEARTIEVGQRLPASGDQPARVEVVNGLQSGEQVIVSGVGFLQDGDVVEVVSGE